MNGRAVSWFRAARKPGEGGQRQPQPKDERTKKSEEASRDAPAASVILIRNATHVRPFVCLFASIRNAPERAVAVFGDKQSPVVRNRNADRPAPDALVIHHKSSQKIVVFARGDAIVATHAHHFVTGAHWLDSTIRGKRRRCRRGTLAGMPPSRRLPV